MYSKVEPFFQILKLEVGSSRFQDFWSRFQGKKRYNRAVIPLSSDKHNADNFNIGRSAKLDYETLINKIKSDNKYENNAI